MKYQNLLNYVVCLLLITLSIISVPLVKDAVTAVSVTFLVIKLAEGMMEITRKHFLNKRVPSKNKVVLITGCDSGFGNSLARRLDELGYSVLATCLFPEGEGARRLSEDCSEKLTVLHMDVTDEESIQKVKSFVEKNVERDALWSIVNNAGIMQCGMAEWTSVEEFQRVFDVNTLGALRVVKAFLPFIKQSKGRIINVNSIGGHCMLPLIAAYCVSKSASIALTTSLQMELQICGVKCISIEPYMYPTRMADNQTLFKMAEKTWDAAPKFIKEDYGMDFLERYKALADVLLSLFVRSDVSEVIDCLEDAITAEDPLLAYTPSGYLDRIIFHILWRVCPCDVKNYLWRLSWDFSAKLSARNTKIKKYKRNS